MKNKTFLLSLVAPLLMASALTSCGGNAMKHGKFTESPQGLRYLYEVTYNNYSWKDVTSWMNSSGKKSTNEAAFGCSGVRYGNFYGRSFDFCVTDMCEFLVRTKHENGHFASIGISIANCKTNKEITDKIISGENLTKEEKTIEKLIPFAMVDGINEHGVVCNTNVVPAKDLKEYLHPEDTDGHYHTRGTNPGKEDLFYQFIPRFILDNATSAKHAVELLRERNITAVNKKGEVCDMFGVDNMGYELHCMIADKDNTYIIELINDQMSIIVGNIMTNYYLSKTTESGAGWERYQLLAQRKSDIRDQDPLEINDIHDMEKLIQFVQYSPCYDPKWDTSIACAKWPTEFAGVNPKPEKLDPITFYNAEEWCKENWEEFVEEQNEEKIGMKDVLQTVKEQIDAARAINPGESGRPELKSETPWISTHAEAYDIKNKILHLVTQEDCDEDGNYSFKEFKL